MRQAQVLVYELDGKLANVLRPVLEPQGWRLRELRNPPAVLEVLREGGEVLVLKLGRDLYEELSLLEQVRWAYPETHIVVAAVADYPELTGFLWEIGAHFVLLPPIEPDHLWEIVTRLMKKGG